MEIQTSLMKTKNSGKPVVISKKYHQFERNIRNLATKALGPMQYVVQESIDENSSYTFLGLYDEANPLIRLASFSTNGMFLNIVHYIFIAIEENSHLIRQA